MTMEANHTTSGNLFADLPSPRTNEFFETIARTDGVSIERIVSSGQSTPEGDWYDQAWDEWVLLLSGSAGLLFETEREPRALKPGDYLMIPARCRHRVAWTDPDRQSIWLAVHIGRSNDTETMTERETIA